MLIVPAIDIRGGQCVRLQEGDPNRQTTYSSDPLDMARRWAEKGAQRIHVVDLDGAFSGEAKCLELAAKMKKETKREIEFGGGLRNAVVVQKALDLGIDKVILGTSALENPGWVKPLIAKDPKRFIVGLDARNGLVATKGWVTTSSVTLEQAVKTMEEMGFLETIFTDISKDGALTGPNIAAVKDLMSKTRMGVYASGGVGAIKDIEALSKISGLCGVIVGKALYDGRVALEDCLKVAAA